MAGFNLLKTLGIFSAGPVNTLDSDSNAPRPAAQRQSAPSNSRTDPPPPKRQRLLSAASIAEHNLRSATEEVEEFDREGSTSTRRRGSATSQTIPQSPIMSHGQLYNGNYLGMSGHSRSNRRRRRSRSNRDDIQDEDMDELARSPKPILSNHRKALLSYNDPADAQILQGSGKFRGKKRLGAADTGHDELSYEPPRTALTTASSSLARKAKVNSNQGPSFEVKGAVCYTKLRYISVPGSPDSEEQGCFLQPPLTATGPELRAFTKGGMTADPYKWLKITEKAKSLSYNPGSQYISISQAADPSLGIGQTMVIKFSSPDTAAQVKKWVARRLTSVIFSEEDSNRLLTVYDKMNEEVSRAIQASPAQALQRPPSRQQAQISPRNTEFSSSAISASSHLQASPQPRVSLRSQMQVSGERSQLAEAAHTPALVRRPPRPSVSLSIQRPTRDRNDRIPISTQETSRPETRSSRIQSIDVDETPTPRRWTDEHPGWEERWKAPLVYNRTTVEKDDIPRLDEGQFLNDNLISFGLRYLFDELAHTDPDLNKRVYFHNSFFYTKLKGPRGTINYDSVKNWTSKVDLLAHDYIVVPINENFHWWVAIICHPGQLDPGSAHLADSNSAETPVAHNLDTNPPETSNNTDSADVNMTGMDYEATIQLGGTDQATIDNMRSVPVEDQGLVRSDVVDLVTDAKDAGADLSPTIKKKQRRKSSALPSKKPKLGDPRIITLDSLGQGHPQAVTVLKKYLIAEFEHKRNKTITDVPNPFGMKATTIPTQDNFCDCGIYLLAYIQQFVENPNKFIQEILDKDQVDWPLDAPDLRRLWRDVILMKQNIKLDSHSLAEQRSREPSVATRAPSKSSAPSNNPSRAPSELTERPRANNSTDGPAVAPRATSRMPMDVYEVSDSEPDMPEQKCKRTSSSPANPTPSARSRVPVHNNDEVVLVDTSSFERHSIRPSIETTDGVAVTPKIPTRQIDKPSFLQKLPVSPGLQELSSKYFYGKQESFSTEPNTKKKRSKSESSAAGSSPTTNGPHHQQPTPKTSQAFHAESHFVVSDVPAVSEVEVIRHDDPIEIDSD
ncbi:ubiquitin-like-specific protease 2 [Cladorrhinum sp. PSN332]|nr:ubiquitin-like-specific protease 2 [Cladorrhinum sp. PSN332]